MAEKLVTVFELDVSGYLEQLRVLNIQIQQAKENQKELAKAAADGNKEAGIQLQEVNAFLKIQQKEYASLQRSLVGFTTANQKNIDTLDFSNNSIKQNRALLSQLTEQYNSMDKVGREKVAPTIKNISDELKRQEGAIGDTRRNVGNYTQSILEAVKGIQGLGGAVDVIGNLGSAFQTAGGGVKGFTAALATTGIPLIVAGLTTLLDILKSYEPLMDLVEDSTDAVAASFKALASGASLGAAIKATNEYRETLRDLEDTQQSFNLNQQAYLNQIQQLIIKSKDRTKSEEERIAALQKASKIEEQALKESSERIDRDFNKLFAAVVETGNLRERDLQDFIYGTEQQVLYYKKQFEKNKAIDKADLQRLQELAVQKAKLLGDSQVLQERITNRQNALEEEIRQDREKRDAEERARLEKLEKARQEAIKKITPNEIKSLEDILKKEKELKDKQFDEETERELNAQVVREQILAKRIGTTKAFIDAELVARNRLLQNEKLTETERQNIILESEDRIAKIKKEAAEKIQKQQEALDKEAVDMAKKTAEEIERANQQALQAGQDAIFQFTNEIIQVGQGIASTVGEILNTVSTLAIQNLEYQYQQGEISARKFNAMVAEEKRKAWKQSKALSITQTIFNTASAVMAQLSNPTPYVGIVLAALAAATGAAQIALIAKQKPPQFAKGGAIQIGGKSHAEGGTPIHVGGKLVAEAEKGENMYILKKEASAQINALSAFNQMFGGRSFSSTPTKFAAEGGMINTGDGGFFTRSVKSNNEISAMRKAFIDGAQSLPAPVVSVKEIDRVNANKNRAIAVSEL